MLSAALNTSHGLFLEVIRTLQQNKFTDRTLYMCDPRPITSETMLFLLGSGAEQKTGGWVRTVIEKVIHVLTGSSTPACGWLMFLWFETGGLRAG